MKNIQPINIWINGQSKEATQLNAYVVNDNLKDSATFYYSLLTIDNLMISEGNIQMSGSDYNGWLTNEYAYDFIANKLGLTIIEIWQQ